MDPHPGGAGPDYFPAPDPGRRRGVPHRARGNSAGVCLSVPPQPGPLAGVDCPVLARPRSSASPRHLRRWGGARAPRYPAQGVGRLGPIIQEPDFIGARFLAGCPQPLYAASRYYAQPFRFGWLGRVTTPSMAVTRQLFFTDWQRYPKADVLTLENAFAFTATGKGPGFLSNLLIFLLNLHVMPVLLPPRKSWSRGSVEGHNSVLARKLWHAADLWLAGRTGLSPCPRQRPVPGLQAAPVGAGLS